MREEVSNKTGMLRIYKCKGKNGLIYLIALGGMLSKIDAGSEHAANIRVSLVKPFLGYGLRMVDQMIVKYIDQ